MYLRFHSKLCYQSLMVSLHYYHSYIGFIVTWKPQLFALTKTEVRLATLITAFYLLWILELLCLGKYYISHLPSQRLRLLHLVIFYMDSLSYFKCNTVKKLSLLPKISIMWWLDLLAKSQYIFLTFVEQAYCGMKLRNH